MISRSGRFNCHGEKFALGLGPSKRGNLHLKHLDILQFSVNLSVVSKQERSPSTFGVAGLSS